MVRRALYDLWCFYFAAPVTVKLKRRVSVHLVTLTSVGIHQSECNPGISHNNQPHCGVNCFCAEILVGDFWLK